MNFLTKLMVEANRQRELWLTDGMNVWFIPQRWCDTFTMALGFTGGPDFVEDGEPSPELYGYGPVTNHPNSNVDTLFFSVDDLAKLREIDESEAGLIHPAMFVHLDAINRGVV